MWVIVSRDLEVITVPWGEKLQLPEGSQVRLTQAAGGSYTVVTDQGVMCRVDERDADAIGESRMPAEKAAADAPYDEAELWRRLRTVYDPEIPINIVDLGLIYNVRAQTLPEGGRRLDIDMTMTAPGCGMGEVLRQEVERKALASPGVKEVHVAVVFDPPWSLDKMSEAARLQLGL